MDLLAHRATILQFSFVDGPKSSSQTASTGEITLQMPHQSRGTEAKREGVVCITCVADPNHRCPRCDLPPVPPRCALCRLPIKGEFGLWTVLTQMLMLLGLSMSCGLCNHRTHSKCFNDHFSPFTSTCPACPCHCLDAQGYTYPMVAIPIPPSRALKGSLNPVNVNVTAPQLSSRTTQSLAEHLRAYGRSSQGQKDAQSQLSRSADSANSALGLETSDNSVKGDRTPTVANPGAADGDARLGLFSKPATVWRGWIDSRGL
jgi:hypothetical protein